ncbi:Lrp/AsnC family transcriptional regulator [Candidatus Harpocratesius sp.]
MAYDHSSSHPILTDLDKLILKVIQFHNPDTVSMSLRNIQAQLEQYKKDFPQVFGDNKNPPSVSTISKRIKFMKENGIILYPTTVIDCSKLGYREMILIFIKVHFNRPIKEILDDLLQIQEINVIYQISGDYPIYCMSKCSDKMHQIEVLERIKQIVGIEDLKTHIVMAKSKEDMRTLIDI